ncbi:hypothetical protein J6E39_07495 [bacterium]|nr:hypothetical protein [bacterium]
MDRDLSIQEIRMLAAYKTNNPNISEKEAVQIMNSVLPDYQNKVNSWGVQSSNASAFGNNIVVSGLTECDTAQVVCNNLFQKLGFIQPKTTEILPVQVPPSEPTTEEIKLFAIDYLKNDLNKALAIYNTQINNQGSISNIFNSGKELFNTEFASSRVGRILANEQLGAQLLELSANYQLSQKDYLEAKLDLAVKLLGADSNDAKYLQSELGKLEPQKLNEFISKVLTLSDEDYAIQIPQIKENLTARALQDEQCANRPRLLDSVNFLNINFKNPNSVASLIENKDSSYKLMDFETTFLKERGVSYKPETITDYTEKQAYLSLVLAANNRNKQIQNLLYDATTAVDGNNKYGAPFQDATGACVNNLERKIIQALTSLYGNDTDKINEVLKQNNASFKDGKIDCLNKSYTLVNISKNIQANLNSNIKSLLNGKTITEYESECKQAYNLAYGEENGTRLAQAFVESQARGVQAIKAGVQGVGILVAIAGQVIPVGGQIASAMIWGGMALGTFGGATVQIAEDATKPGGITEEDKKAIFKEIATSAALMASGMGIGKISSMAYAELVMQNCPRLAALVSKVGLDASLSVLADYAITGQVDLTSEGISQLIPVLVGLTKTKGSMYTFVTQKLHDISDPASLKYWDANPEKLTELVMVLSRNRTPIGRLAQLSPAHWDVIINSVKNPPQGEFHKSIMVYKYDSGNINWALTDLKKNNVQPSHEIQQHIDNITAYIDKQAIKEPIKVYRDDSYGIIDIVQLSNGKSLGNELRAIAQIKDVKTREQLLDNIRYEDIMINQERFMSTSMCEDVHFNESDIRWEFDLPAGTKGTFIESYNTETTKGNQTEFLLQRNSQISIKDIEYENGVWKIYADIKN